MPSQGPGVVRVGQFQTEKDGKQRNQHPMTILPVHSKWLGFSCKPEKYSRGSLWHSLPDTLAGAAWRGQVGSSRGGACCLATCLHRVAAAADLVSVGWWEESEGPTGWSLKQFLEI
jgi:hypothetical protein